ncbi:MAG: hypothetical protein J0L92_11010 [Deltaproteobacteria bacterium]|nr:hypothetical protein [Deltaproteobacteria bacterium]
MTTASPSTPKGPSRALTIAAVVVSCLALGVWLLALGLLVRQLDTVGSPPRIATWDGPPEDDNLPQRAFLFEDEAWLLRDGSDRSVMVRVDLPRGVAETGWDLSPFGPRSLEVQGIARREDGWITLVIEHRGLTAITLTREREVLSHGTAPVDTTVGVLGVRWVGSTLHAALGNGTRVSWRDGHASIAPIAGSPQPDWRTRDTWLAAARWTDLGWGVLVWESPDRWRWTLGDSDAHGEWAATYGGVGHRFAPFHTPVHVGSPGLGAPPNDEVRARDEPGRALRWIGEGRWENASASGGFWDWCLPRGDRWICVSHDAMAHHTEIFDEEGHRASHAVHDRFAPADPVIVEASGGGFWVLDLSNTSEDGRIYYRLTDELERADALSWRERYERARPRTHEQARMWQATSGPSAMIWPANDTAFAIAFFLATIELPISLFSFPIAIVVFPIAALALRVERRGAAVLALSVFGAQLVLALLAMTGFVSLLRFV